MVKKQHKVMILIYGFLYVFIIIMAIYFCNLNENCCYRAMFLWKQKFYEYRYIGDMAAMVAITLL